ncbi:ASCH/PUA domain-containing protein [Pectinatus frisingensis]|uniref:ASCH/PUA domain-containing protein n=1 Tax=Pectinatus frisingensis TaxID=865 RepID=UPI0018C7AE86|nr:ASCH/PUA domain-containing protein [Pectinatus frisingensis]
MIHKLKILPEYFEQVVTGNKSFEIRRNDRNFQIGDRLYLQELDGEKFTGRLTVRTITYITDYAQKENYVVMGIKNANNIKNMK